MAAPYRQQQQPMQPRPAAPPAPIPERAFLRASEKHGIAKPDEHVVRAVEDAARTMQTSEIAKRFLIAFDRQRGSGANIEGAGFQNALTLHYFELLRQRALQPSEVKSSMEKLKIDLQREIFTSLLWVKKYGIAHQETLKKQLDIGFAGVQNALFTIRDLYKLPAMRDGHAMLGINDTLDAGHMIDLIKIEENAANPLQRIVTLYQLKGANDTTPDSKIITAHTEYVQPLLHEDAGKAREAEMGFDTWVRNELQLKDARIMVQEFWERLNLAHVLNAEELVRFLNHPTGITKAELQRRLQHPENAELLAHVALYSEYGPLDPNMPEAAVMAQLAQDVLKIKNALQTWARTTTLTHAEVVQLPHAALAPRTFLGRSANTRYESVLAKVDRAQAKVEYRTLKPSI